MFLRSNSRAAGLIYEGQPLQAEYVAAFDGGDIVPTPLSDGAWNCRHPRADELEFLIDWRVDFAREALQFPDSPTLRSECEHELRLVHERGSNWVLEDGGLVSYSAFNAQLPDIVQIGGVWTPLELRGRGYGRAVVAGSLLEVRELGVRRAVLFAERDDAKRAYRGIGFRVVGEYGLVLFGGS